MHVSARLLLVNAELTKRSAARERRRALERELAGFATPADREDLLATLERYPEPVAEEVRSILERQAARELLGYRGSGAFRIRR